MNGSLKDPSLRGDRSRAGLGDGVVLIGRTAANSNRPEDRTLMENRHAAGQRHILSGCYTAHAEQRGARLDERGERAARSGKRASRMRFGKRQIEGAGPGTVHSGRKDQLAASVQDDDGRADIEKPSLDDRRLGGFRRIVERDRLNEDWHGRPPAKLNRVRDAGGIPEISR